MTTPYPEAQRGGEHHLPLESAPRRSLLSAGIVAIIVVFAALLKIVLLTRAVGFEQGDPLEYINIAHTIAYRTGEEWWDIRPILYPLMLVPLAWIGGWLPDPTGEAAVRLLRTVPLAFSLGCLVLSAAIANSLSGRLASISATLILAVNPIFNQLSVSPFAELPATFGVLCAALVAIRARPSAATGAAVGVALGSACMARYQSLAFIAPFGVWMLLGRRVPRLAGFVGGLIACTAMQGVLDALAYGAPFHSLVQSAAYNVISDEAASFYGAEPFTWYLQAIGDWLGYPVTALALAGAVAASKSHARWSWALVLGLAIAMLIWLSAIAHKEPRFTSQITPFLAIAAGHGAWCIASIGRRLGTVGVAPVIAVATIPGLWESWTLDLTFNPGFVDGPKWVSTQHPGSVLGTIPWFIARPYTHNRIEVVRADVDRWKDRDYMASTLERADYLLLREYDFSTDRVIQRLVDSQYRTVERYPEQVVLLEKRRTSAPRGR